MLMPSLHSLAMILILPLLITLLTTLLAGSSTMTTSGNWVGWEWPGWPALEAIGTVFAVLAAILLAWWEGTASKRRAKRIKLTLRKLLVLEIEPMLDHLAAFSERSSATASQRDAEPSTVVASGFLYELATNPVKEYSYIRNSLREQLTLFCETVDPVEVTLFQDFYAKLDDFMEIQGKVLLLRRETLTSFIPETPDHARLEFERQVAANLQLSLLTSSAVDEITQMITETQTAGSRLTQSLRDPQRLR